MTRALGDAEAADPPAEQEREPDVEQALDRVVDEGRRRMSRRWAPLWATGIVGGIDVGAGVLAMLVVEHAAGDTPGAKVLGGLAFSVGFIALTLARSELFTEDFLVPVTAVAAKHATVRQLLRLWVVTLLANLAGGWLFTRLIIWGYPELSRTAVEAGHHYVGLGTGWRAFSLAMLGGAVITLMTWMQHQTESLGVKIVPAVTTAFLLVGAQLDHGIVNSLLLFAGLHTGAAPYGYLDWLAVAAWALLGNVVGGIGLVTALRLLQAPHRLVEQRQEAEESGAADRARER